jgi:hypothetical protein
VGRLQGFFLALTGTGSSKRLMGGFTVRIEREIREKVMKAVSYEGRADSIRRSTQGGYGLLNGLLQGRKCGKEAELCLRKRR